MRTVWSGLLVLAVGVLVASVPGLGNSLHPATPGIVSTGASLLRPMGIVAIGSSHAFAGYAVVGAKTVSSLHADWKVPKVHGSCPAIRDEGTFVGISLGGYTTKVGVFVGTGTYCHLGTAGYEGYYLIGTYAFLTSFKVAPGDHMRATIVYAKSTLSGSIVLKDLTRGGSVTAPFTGTLATHQDVLWGDYAAYSTSTGRINPLVDFGSVAFRNCTAALNGTTLHNLGHYSDTAIEMYDKTNTVFKADVSTLTSANTGFTVKWASTGP